MLSISINLISVITIIVLIFCLAIFPKSMVKQNKYFILLMSFLGLNLVLVQLQMLNILSITSYLPMGLTLIVWYGPSFFFYAARAHGNAEGNIFQHLLVVGSGIWIIYGLKAFDYVLPGLVLTVYFVCVLLYYFFRSFLFQKNDLASDKWFKTCRVWYAAITTFFLVESVWLNVDPQSELAFSSYMVVIFSTINLIFIMTSLAFLLRHPDIFSTMKMIRSYQHQDVQISNSEVDLVFQFVATNERFCDAALDRTKVMESTGLSVNRISEIVNNRFNKNFNEWINDYRINLSKDLLSSSDESIKEICFRVGFNSRSAFNTAFKKRTEMTPSQFRRKVVNSASIT